MNNFKYTFNTPIRIFADGGIVPDDIGYESANDVFNGFTLPSMSNTEEPQFNPVPIEDVTPDSELIPLKSVDNVTKKAGNRYTIKRGDSLWKIARMHNMSLSELLKENPNLSINDTIYAGDKINVGSHRVKTNPTFRTKKYSKKTATKTNSSSNRYPADGRYMKRIKATNYTQPYDRYQRQPVNWHWKIPYTGTSLDLFTPIYTGFKRYTK